VTAAVATLAWQHMWALIEKRPLQLDQPLAAIDVMAVRDVTVLVLSCEHAFCDGISLSTAAHALLAFMAAAHERTSGSVGTDAPVEITARVWGPPCEVAALAKFETRELDARMDGLSAFTRPEDVDVIPTDQPQLNGMGLSAICSTRVGVHTLSVSQSTALIQACRAHGTTVSAVLGAAFMHALADTIAGAAGSAACLAPTPADKADGTSPNATSRALTISLSCAADTRRLYRPPLDSTCLAYHASGLAPFPAQLIPGHDAAARVWTLSGQVCVASGCVLGARCGELGDGAAALFRDQFYLLFVDVLFGAWSRGRSCAATYQRVWQSVFPCRFWLSWAKPWRPKFRRMRHRCRVRRRRVCCRRGECRRCWHLMYAIDLLSGLSRCASVLVRPCKWCG
jgi:hypothetical protein